MPLRPLRSNCTFFGWSTIFAFAAALAAPLAARATTITVPPGGNLQAAIDAAQPGDTIVLTAGAAYVGNFILRVKPGASEIIIRTAPDPRQPAAGRRIDPIAHSGLLALIRSGNSLPAFQTEAGAHHWRLQLLELAATAGGYGEIVRLGLGGSDQSTLASVPYEITIDRCYIHGDPLQGQKRGISLNSASTTIRDSYISDMKGVGLDTQAIAGWNGPGPYVIENNYLEGAGENVLFGGADPKISSLVPSDITFRLNHLFKRGDWQQPIIPAPTGVAAASRVGGGTLAAGTYAYRVVARRDVGQGTVGNSLPSAEVSATLASPGAVAITWAPVPNAKEYWVYGRTAGSQTTFWTVATAAFTDAGAAGTAGSPPTTGTRWTVKNIFELKNARRVLVEGNVLEWCWRDGQNGVGVVFTPRNQDGTAPWSTVEDVTFRYNIVRHVGAGINVNGYDTNHPSQPARNILIENNLVYDVTSDGTTGRFLQIGNAPGNLTVNHNTSIQTGTLLYAYTKHTDGTYDVVQGFGFTNNLALHGTYGIQGESAGGYGLLSIRAYFLDDWRVTANVLAGGVVSKYPAGNFFPDVTTFYAQFADSSYRLRTDSPYKGAGTDAKDLGADIDGLTALTDLALSGDTTLNQAPTAATNGPYTALTLTNVAFDGTGSWDPDGTLVSYKWSWSDGSPDTQGAAVTHQFARAGTYQITLAVTDDQGATSSTTTTATILDRSPVAVAGGPYTTKQGATVSVSAAGSADPDGTITSYRWNWGDGTADTAGVSAAATHVYTAGGNYTLTLTVADDGGLSTSARTTMTVVKPLEIVIYPAELPAAAMHGAWTRAVDASAAGGAKLVTADAGFASTSAPLASPVHYFDVTFQAIAGVDYRLWLRMAALANSKWNDSLWVQLSGAIDAAGSPLYPIGTANALDVNLATTVSAGSLSGWGWQNGAYWLAQTTTVRFATTGLQTLRVQVREDGVQIDQIVLSAAKYLSAAPGTASADTHIVPKP